MLFHISGAGSFGLFTSKSVDGPFVKTAIALGGCNNPTAAFHPNSSLFIMCHDDHFNLHGFHPDGGRPAWESKPAPAIPTLVQGAAGTDRRNVEGNCEDPWISFDASGRFHVIAHCCEDLGG